MLSEQIPGLGLGFPIGRLGLGDVQSDLQTFQSALTAADQLWQADQASGSYGDEIAAYQAAATSAIGTIPSELDSSQSALIQQASSANDQLQNISSQSTTDQQTGDTTGPTADDAQQAHDLAYQMLTNYQNAANYSPPPTNLPPPPTPGGTTGGTTSGSGGGSAGGATGGTSNVTVNTSSTGKDLAIAGAVAAAGFGGWWLWNNRKRFF